MELLKSGQKLSIFFQKGDKLVEMACTIVDLLDDRLTVELPPYFMRYIEYLSVGCPLTVKVFSKIGTVDFNTVVISSPMEDEFAVELDYNAMKLTTGEEIPVINAVENLNIKFEERFFRVSTFEISTEYIKFTSDYNFHLDDILDCELVLSKNYGIIKFKGIIVYVDPVYDNEFQVKISSMLEEHRQELLYYMYMYSNNTN